MHLDAGNLVSLLGFLLAAAGVITSNAQLAGRITERLDTLKATIEEMRTGMKALEVDARTRSELVAQIKQMVESLDREARYQRRWRHWAQNALNTLGLRAGVTFGDQPGMDE